MGKPHTAQILYVEDDAIASRIGMSMINLVEDAEATHATTGCDAINLYTKKTFDLLIIDLGLPDITGAEVVSILKKQHNLTIPVIAVSAHTDPEAITPKHIDRIYSKPLTFELLQEILNTYVRTN